MSLPPNLDPGNPANTNSEYWRRTHNFTVKRSPATRSDWILTAFIVGLFALGILYALIQQHFY